MSNLTKDTAYPCHHHEGAGVVAHIIQPDEKDLGGFSVRRSLPSSTNAMIGPWVFFDHFGPVTFNQGDGIDIRPHPHINIATLTYLFEGEIVHRDSLGNTQPIQPGDINLMVAGSGIVHSERERAEIKNSEHRLHGLQLWLALPEQFEEMDPAFYHYPASAIPLVKIDNIPIRILVGSAYDATSPVKTYCDTLYLEVKLQPGESIKLPDAEEIGIYPITGDAKVGNCIITEQSMAILKPGLNELIETTQPSQLIVIGGEKLGHRYLEWNFASSRKARIEQAKMDWKNKRFDLVPGDEKEFIPLPD